MKLTSLFISIEHATKLEKLGFKQVSCFYWYQERISTDLQLFKSDVTQLMIPWKYSIGKPANDNNTIFKTISAFTAGELGEFIPNYIKANNTDLKLCFCYRGLKGWEYSYEDIKDENPIIRVFAETEQDARAKLLIACIEAGYITIEDTIIK